MSAEIRALIVDDEPLARERLRTLLAAEQGVAVVRECRNGEEAVAAILSLDPDLVFLDVQMPVVDGFGVIDEVGAERMPVVVFATAFDEFALKAFDAHAVDYLLKPIGEERLRVALERTRKRLTQASVAQFPPQFLAWMRGAGGAAEAAAPWRDRFAVREGQRYVVVRTADIVWIEAEGNYVRLHTPSGGHLLRTGLGELAKELDPRAFLRIHRSVIVNVNRVAEIEPWGLGEYLLVLPGGKKLSSSRRYRHAIRDAFGC